MLRQVDVPEGESGRWSVQRFTVTEEESIFDGIRSGSRRVLPGTYTRLSRGGVVVMSDTPAELRDHYWAYRCAQGHVLVNGLGLGMYVDNILRKDDVTQVTVVEIAYEVIELVAPWLWGNHGNCRLTIINDDALKYKPPKGERYGFVWHDIWDTICLDNKKSMSTLHRKYGRRCDNQGSWSRAELKQLERRQRNNSWGSLGWR